MASDLATRPALDSVVDIVRAAARAVMQVYAHAFDVREKADASPVTEADERAEAIIVPALRALAPGVPVVAEEMSARGAADTLVRDATGQARGRFWLVDPLDGTKEFVKRNGEFTVNIALIEDGAPVLGVVMAPACDELYAGVVGAGAWCEARGQVRRPIAVRVPPPAGLVVVASRSHRDDGALARFVAKHRVAEVRQRGSSLKLCLLAAGEADVYPRMTPTMAWDIAAGQAVLEAAGGRVITADGSALRYGGRGFENPHFTAWGG